MTGADFVSLEWKNSTQKFVETSVKAKKPSSLAKVVRRQGDKVVYMVPAKSSYILTVITESGNKFEEDIYGIIKYHLPSNKRITPRFRECFEKHMKQQMYTVDESRNAIVGLYGMVADFTNKWEKRWKPLFYVFGIEIDGKL